MSAPLGGREGGREGEGREVRKGGREGGREGEREVKRERGRRIGEREKWRGREGGRGGGREKERDSLIQQIVDHITLVVLGGKVERCLLVHVSAIHNLLLGIQQDLHHLHKPVPGSNMQWCDILFLAGLDISFKVEENPYDLLTPTLTGEMERSAENVILCSDKILFVFEPKSKEEFDNIGKTLLAGKVQRCLLLVIQGEHTVASFLHPLQQCLHNHFVA